MQIKNSTITFWFLKQQNPKIYVEKLNEILNEHFFEFNIIGVPANIDPAIPRLTAVSSSNHSNVEISLINAKLTTRFDENFHKDINSCIKYLKERALKLFQGLSECEIDILYSAIFINLEKQENNAVNKIKERFLKVTNNEIEEIGIRFSQQVDNKYYRNISFNNSRTIKIKTTFDENNKEIILPLISLNQASKVESFINLSVEINDRLSYNLDESYNTKKTNLLELFNLSKEYLEKEMEDFDKK